VGHDKLLMAFDSVASSTGINAEILSLMRLSFFLKKSHREKAESNHVYF
jgi:hypothetical protein